ncbi:MAG: hypothetical protein E7670_02855 [Ruminococcaceae bacterium]|nr:hypothetical protein [Oscillospiraceae bacterium]
MALNTSDFVAGVLVGGISLSPDADGSEACSVCASELKRAGLDPAQLHFEVAKRSVDARKKNDVRIVWSVSARFSEPRRVRFPLKCRYNVTPLRDEKLEIKRGEEKCSLPPLVVGMGPAGLFCALLLAENGYRPILIDRGDNVYERVKKHETFVRFGILDTESNIQFGAGGAGTFSDGKLLTRINDPKISYVLHRFCDFGAPTEILVAAKPHIGTDLLCGIVDRMIARVEELGGSVRYRCRLDGIKQMIDGNIEVTTNDGDIACSSVVLATGHSARDTYAMLMRSGFCVEAKPFSVGVRIEHKREDIDTALYGKFAGHERVGKGEYHLSDTASGRGVYTFCMCPGGEVVAAASEEGGVVVNGMSRFARDGRNSNSAVAVTVRPTDFDGTPAGAIAFQRKLERAAFSAGGGEYYAPMQTVGDFLNGSFGTEPSDILPTYRDGKVKLSDLNEVLPQFVTDELRRGLVSFDRKLKGFAKPSAILCGVESRTSAPVRIMRDESLVAKGVDKVYPCGEGAGYAGGITSAAVDGLRVALAIMERFAPCEEKA